MSHEAVGDVLVVIGDGDDALYEEAVSGLPRLLPPVIGGAARQAIGAERTGGAGVARRRASSWCTTRRGRS